MQGRKTSANIRVIGLVAGTHKLEDIGMDIPHGVTVTIPGDLAVISKDLWRAISQRCIFQLPSVASTPTTQPVSYDRDNLEAQNAALSAQIKKLESDNRMLLESLKQIQESYEQKLDLILLAVRNKVVVSEEKGSSSLPPEEVVDGTAPIFIPSEIHPKDVDIRIDVQGEAAESNVADTANLLRNFKKAEK